MIRSFSQCYFKNKCWLHQILDEGFCVCYHDLSDSNDKYNNAPFGTVTEHTGHRGYVICGKYVTVREKTDWHNNRSFVASYLAETSGNVLRTCAPSGYSNQSAHSHSLIRIITWRVMYSQGCKVSSCGQRRFWSDCANTQADLNLRWAHMSEGTFSDVAANFYLLNLLCLLVGKWWAKWTSGFQLNLEIIWLHAPINFSIGYNGKSQKVSYPASILL